MASVRNSGNRGKPAPCVVYLSILEQLKAHTTVVADTGEVGAIRTYAPEDATTNPSLILKAVSGEQSEYAALLTNILEEARQQAPDVESQIAWAADRLIVAIGSEILQVIPGRISTEVDARLSFDRQGTLAKARQLITLYEQAGVSRERVLIKIAATWEGIRAAEELEREGIHCNLTLLFGFAQARASAEAGVTLISPFVGRILDWYKAKTGQQYEEPDLDPGVQSVSRIYRYYKQHGYPTVVMGASFRNIGEILALVGCDRLTISPALLEQLSSQQGELARRLDYKGELLPRPEPIDEASFRWELNQDAMATEKLAEGIRAFAADQEQLEALLRARLA